MNGDQQMHFESNVEGDEGEELDDGEDGDEDEGEEHVLEEAENGSHRGFAVHRVEEGVADVLLGRREKRYVFN